jgi:hypothetical protein
MIENSDLMVVGFLELEELRLPPRARRRHGPQYDTRHAE